MRGDPEPENGRDIMPEPSTYFIYVRHGETDGNIGGHLQGWANGQLTENGRAQAKAVAEALRNEKIDAIFTSDLDRARCTAEAIRDAGHTGIPFIITKMLREWNTGDCDDISWTGLREKYPELADTFLREQGESAFPNGESRVQCQERINRFLDNCLAEWRGGRVLLVSHGGVLQRVFRRVAGVVDPGNLVPLAGNASINRFHYDGARQAWQLTEWNNRAHLTGLPEHLLFG